MQVLWDHILVRPHGVKEARSKGGIIMAPVSKEGGRDCQFGTVIATGEGVPQSDGSLRPHVVKPGDTVHFGYHVGMCIRLDGDTEVVVIVERDVKAFEPGTGQPD